MQWRKYLLRVKWQSNWCLEGFEVGWFSSEIWRNAKSQPLEGEALGTENTSHDVGKPLLCLGKKATGAGTVTGKTRRRWAEARWCRAWGPWVWLFFFSFRKRPVSWWVTQVGHGPQGSCPPKGRPPDKTLCEACSSGPSWLALDGVWGARGTHREVI